MYQVLGTSDASDWNACLHEFPGADVYYTADYYRLYEINGDGKPLLFYYEDKHGKVLYPFLLRPIESSNLHDISTPYGYGGPLYLTGGDLLSLKANFNQAFTAWSINHNIVTEFVRFHPLLHNHRLSSSVMDVEAVRSTVEIPLKCQDSIWNGLTSRNRNSIRNAQRAGLQVQRDESLRQFLRLYHQTMTKVKAAPYYYFSTPYFAAIESMLGRLATVFNVIHEDTVIASTIILHFNKSLHYHLSGSDPTFLSLSPNNLLLYEVALWGTAHEYSHFHLGGGYSGDNDSLFAFKKSFSKADPCTFYVGKRIHNQQMYDELVSKYPRENHTNYFPLYRAPVEGD